jgi:alkylated DNA repair dioxygenase AlkB
VTGQSWRILPGWAADPQLLPALRTLYAYTDREPGRATGWLWLPAGQPVTPWPPVLAAPGARLLEDLERDTGIRFAAACFQAYLDGSGVGWHHDRDWDAQAILSLGVTRTFGLRRGGQETFVRLAHGDLLVMPPGFQDDGWEHCVPVEQVTGERCSIVFRSS